ncbi:hypothetical protein BGZ82_002483 [Podila clonocystis]|nr:hypothetical protein BGZ82_002483 [Podila clonocystis]
MSHCTSLPSAPGWKMQHCVQPLKEHCRQGGYLRIERLSSPLDPPADPSRTTCFSYNTPGFVPRPLSSNASHHDYVAYSLGPEAFHVEIVGPERHIWVQQQFLGNCTYAVPYHVSTPGRYWIANVVHTFDNFEGLDELAAKNMWPLVLNNNIFSNSTTEGERAFDVCKNPSPLPPRLEIYLGSPSGAYKAPTAPKSYLKALDVEQYEWVSKTNLLTMANIRSITASKAPAGAGNSVLSCLVNSRRMFQFNGDSHIRVLYKSLVHQLQSLPGDITMSHEYYFPPVRIGRTQVNYKFENHFDTVSRMLDAYDFNSDDGAYLDWVQPLDVVDEEMQHFQELFKTLVYTDILVVGWGHWHSAMVMQGGHWTTEAFIIRTEDLLRRFLKLQRHRRQMGMRHLVLAWAGLPASTENFARIDPNLDDADWRTNQRLAYWDRLCNMLVDRLNAEEAGQVRKEQNELRQPAIVKLYAFEKTLPYKAHAADYHHFTRTNVVSAQLSELLPQIRDITGC